MRCKVVAIVGPTGSGKTKLAVKVASRFDGVIISADSRQVYRGLDVGSNKEGVATFWRGLPAREIDGISQLLVDVADPGEKFNLHRWLVLAHDALEKVWHEGKLPIVVGGTGLYATALLEGYQLPKDKIEPDFESLVLEVEVDRSILYQRADERYQNIWPKLLNEIKNLESRGVPKDWLSRLGLDYKIACQFLDGDLLKEEAIQKYSGESHAYIRRQLTWWRHHLNPVKVANYPQAQKLVAIFKNRAT